MLNRVVLATPLLIAILLIGTISSSVNFASAGMESSPTGIAISGSPNSSVSALPPMTTPKIPAMPDILKLPATPALYKTQKTVGPLVAITAAQSGDWNNGTTWVGGIVPGVSDNKIIPSGINVTVTTKVDNNGTITNSGTITVANSDSNSIGIFCHDSDSAIINNSGGQIMVVNTGTTSDGIVSYGTLTNSGTIKILNSGTNSYGIQNSNTLTNSGTITISNSGYIGILNIASISNSGTITILNSINPSYGIVNYIIGTLTNSGTITVANSGVGSQGIYNFVTITNNSGGQITVTSSGDSGITNGDGSTLTNSGTITISSSGPYGIYNQHTFTNNSGGQVIVSNTAASSYGIVNYNGNIITNSGTITVKNTGTSSTGISNSGNFTNSGTMGISGNFTNVAGATLVNIGTLGLNHGDTITFTGPSTYSGSFTNNGKFTMKPKSFVTLGSGTQLTIISGTLTNPSGVTLSILSTSSLNVNSGTKILNSGAVTFQGKINNSGSITNNNMIKKLCGGIFSGNPITGNPITSVCNPTVTLVTPNPSTVTHSMMIIFTATVTDSSATPVVPTGKVSWNDGHAGGHFNSVTCTLAATSPSQSHCSVTYKAPLTTGMDTITGAYSGDNSHVKSAGTSKLTVT